MSTHSEQNEHSPRRQPGDQESGQEESKAEPSGRYSYEGLERVIHEKARLGIMASLASHSRGLLFGDLKALCALTDGNLSRHLQMLQDAGLVEVWKGYKKNRPQTLCQLTETGRKRFLEYISVLENVVADAMHATHATSASAGAAAGSSTGLARGASAGRAAEARLAHGKGS